MNWVAGVIVFVLLWWCVFFAVLPWGVRGLHETGETVEGAEPGAPSRPMLGRKAAVTTGLAAVLWAIIYWLVASGFIDIGAQVAF